MPYFIEIRIPQEEGVNPDHASKFEGPYRSLVATRRAARHWSDIRLYRPVAIVYEPSGRRFPLEKERP